MTRNNPLFHELIDERKSMIGIVSGKRGSGKSVFGYRVAELYHDYTGDITYVLGFPEEKRNLLPKFIEPLEIGNIEQATGTYVFVDEGALVLFSRNFYSEVNKFISMLLAVSRHYDISIQVATQTTALIDLNILRMMDYLIIRKYSYYSIRFEREEVKPLIYRAQRYIRGRPDLGMVYGDFQPPNFVMKNKLPSFWTPQLSKIWRLALKKEREKRLLNKQKLMEQLLTLNPDLSNEELARLLKTSKKAITVMKARMKARLNREGRCSKITASMR